MIRIAFDIGGVLGKHITAQKFLDVCRTAEMLSVGIEVFVLTDMKRERAEKLLIDNMYGWVVAQHRLICADYAMHQERCKAVECLRHKIDILIDDHLPYVCAGDHFLGLLVAPRVDRKYALPGWE